MGSDGSVLREELERWSDSNTVHINDDYVAISVLASRCFTSKQQ